LAQSGLATANYTLQAANVVEVATGTAATGPTCPASVTLGLDNTSVASVAAGGATHNVEICYGIGGAAAPVLTGACVPPALLAGQACFNSGALGTTTSTITPTPTETETLHISTCKAGFNPPAALPATVAVTPYANPITPNGSLAQFTPADTFAGTGGVTGYFSYDATNLYFGESGYTVATGSDVVIYLGVGAATDSTTGPPALGSLALPFPAHWAIAWASDDSTAPTVFAWSGTAWATTTAIPVTVGFESGASVVFAVPIAALGGPAVVDVKGAFVTGVGSTPATPAVWPAASHIAETLAACTQPSSSVVTP
jgi:hypothetical protein